MTKTIDDVMREHHDVLARREAARQAFVAADADARALTEAIKDQGLKDVSGASPLNYRADWMRAAERARAALFNTLLPNALPEELVKAFTKWTKFVSDVDAAR